MPQGGPVQQNGAECARALVFNDACPVATAAAAYLVSAPSFWYTCSKDLLATCNLS